MSQSPKELWLSPRNGQFTPWMNQGQFSHTFCCLPFRGLAACFSRSQTYIDSRFVPSCHLATHSGLCLKLCLSAHVSIASGLALTVTELHPSLGWIKLLHTYTHRCSGKYRDLFFFPVVHWAVMGMAQKRGITRSAMGFWMIVNRKAFWMMPLLSKQHSIPAPYCTAALWWRIQIYWIIWVFFFSILMLPIRIMTKSSLWVSDYYLSENGFRHNRESHEMENKQAK